MKPRIILYAIFILTMIPVWGVTTQYLRLTASVDPQLNRQLIESIAMLGMFSWPLWLGVAGYALVKWRNFKWFEVAGAALPMVYFLTIYTIVLTGN